MKKMKTYLVMILVVLLGACNPKKTIFNSDEASFLNTYDIGDTLIFRSNQNEFDTTVIIDKAIFYPEFIPIEVHGKYLPHTAEIKYRRLPKQDTLRFISMTKNKPEETSLFLAYTGGMGFFLINSENDLGLDPILEGETYVFEMEEEKEGRAQTIYWHKERGIVKYIMVDGTVWNRIN